MNLSIRKSLVYVLVLTLLTSCSKNEDYWIPPSSAPTQQVASAFLPDSSILSPSPSPAFASPYPTPTLTPDAPVPAITQPYSASPTDSLASIATAILALPTPAPPTATPEISVVNTAPILYYAQAADTLPVIAIRYGVQPAEIFSSQPIPETGFIDPGQLLIIPRRLTNTTSSKQLLPDSEVVHSPSTIGFDAKQFAEQAGGYLRSFEEWHKSTGMKPGADIVTRVAVENSINPRLLLALLEYHSQWVYGKPVNSDGTDYPMGYKALHAKGLYNQLVWTVNQISTGYYAYREGRLTEIQFADGVKARLAPDMNAGTAALQYYFAQLYTGQQWLDALNSESGFPALHKIMFGDPWERAQHVEPLFPPGISQPPLTLPFGKNWTWSYTGGPHGAWEQEGAYAALDFAPGSKESGCVDSNAWVVASSAGLVVRTGKGLVVLDLDGDGYEQTGWVLVYLHVATKDRILLGTWVDAGDPLGHPSCEGGFATGTHLHIARKFNGEWVPADGPLAFNLGGWIAHYGGLAYKGTLTRDGVTLTACTCSNYKTFITRNDEDP